MNKKYDCLPEMPEELYSVFKSLKYELKSDKKYQKKIIISIYVFLLI